MIITCPNCSSRYKVKDGLITEKGKKVKCRKCGAIFIAYSDRDAVLEKAPEAGATTVIQESAGQTGLGAERPAPPKAPETPPAPPAPEATPPAAGPPSATVKVDRSKLDAFLQQGPQQGEETASTVQIDPARFQAMLDKQSQAEPGPDGVSPRATVQVDRSEIDAFIKKGMDPEDGAEVPPPVDPDQPVDSFATQAIPAFDPEKMGLETTPPAPAEPPVVQEPEQPAPPEPAPEPDFSGLDAPASFADEPVAPEEPAFPSDADLGIGDAPQAAPAIDQAAPTEALPVQQPPAPPPPVAEPAAAAVPEPDAPETRYKARVDGNIYPNLTLESISRWVKEGRLLDSDEIALEGTEDYRKAVAYDEIKPYFDQFFGEQGGGQSSEKKGFFAKLFSFGK